MSASFFIVSPDPNDPFGILVSIRADAPQELPADQLGLVSEIQATVTTLRLWNRQAADDASATRYVGRILSLAQVGLVGPPPRPDAARRLLNDLKTEMVEREAAPVKNRYLRGLLFWTLGANVALLGLVELASLAHTPTPPQQPWELTLALMVSGCTIGVWLAFAARRVELSFTDLGKPQVDRLSHPMRLLLFGLLIAVLGVAILSDLVKIELAGFNLASIKTSRMAAWLLGVFGGLAEYSLAAFVGKSSKSF